MNVFLNGEFMPIEQARIPVLDRGFIFGDGVYEMIPAYSRIPFRLTEHLGRLAASLLAVSITNPYGESSWAEIIGKVIGSNPWEDQGLYLQVTRGVAPRDHSFKQLTPTVFIMSNPLSTPSPEQVQNGVAAMTHEDFRWSRCDIKSTSLLGNCMLRTMATDAGCAETILIRDGHVTEASASNVFLVSHGVILAPPKSKLMLPGITYDVVLELIRAEHLRHEVRDLTELDLRSGEEVWITSSSREVLAVTTLNGQSVGDGKPGPMFRRIHSLYQRYKASTMRNKSNAPAT